MALLFMDGFDHYSTAADAGTKWPAPGVVNASIQTAAGRRGGGCLRMGSAITNATKYLPAVSGATGCVGVAYKQSVGAPADVITVLETAIAHLTLSVSNTGVLTVYRGTSGGTSLGASSAGAFDYLAGFAFIEMKWTIDNSAGAVEVRVNGVAVIGPLTSQDTQNAGTASWNSVKFGAGNNAGSNDYDDFYALDGSGGGTLATFLGDVRVDTVYPTGNGNTSGSTPSTGTNRGTTVDEPSTTNTTYYNTLTAVNYKDTLTLTDAPNVGATPLGVQVNVYALKTDAGIGTLAPVLRHSGTDYDGTAKALNTSYGFNVCQAYGLNPAGGAWTESDFNALEVGYKRVS
jgi:hypothetical protein